MLISSSATRIFFWPPFITVILANSLGQGEFKGSALAEAAPVFQFTAHPLCQHPCNTEAETCARLIGERIFDTVEAIEDRLPLRLGDSGAAVGDDNAC